MKKVLIALALVSVFASFRPGYAENQYFEARLGSLFPWSIQPGFLGEVAYGFRIDRMVSINVSADYYMTAFTTSTNAAPDTGIQTQGLSSELTANLIAFLLNARIDIPVIWWDIVQPYAQVGVGYEVMVNAYRSSGTNNTYVFGGFGMKLGAGTRIRLGERTFLTVDLGYNFCTVSRSRTTTDTVIVGERIDVSGFSLMGGISFQL